MESKLFIHSRIIRTNEYLVKGNSALFYTKNIPTNVESSGFKLSVNTVKAEVRYHGTLGCTFLYICTCDERSPVI